jgi:hypothetical protein
VGLAALVFALLLRLSRAPSTSVLEAP